MHSPRAWDVSREISLFSMVQELDEQGVVNPSSAQFSRLFKHAYHTNTHNVPLSLLFPDLDVKRYLLRQWSSDPDKLKYLTLWLRCVIERRKVGISASALRLPRFVLCSCDPCKPR